MGKPWIGIPTRYHDKSEIVGQIRHYLDAVIWAGGLPLMIPTTADKSVIREYAEKIDGILLTGSPTDINPAIYGAEPHPKLGRSYPERDTTDLTLLEYGESERLPVLGICFGVQSLNVYRGGTLIQDIPTVVSNPRIHDIDDTPEDPKQARHPVRLERESLLSTLAGRAEVDVNSYHHQGIDRPGRDLRVVAKAPDGLIEAVEDINGRFVVGVQWHPERGWKEDPFSQALFKKFIEEAEKSKRGRAREI